jgi:hypothetical protein
VKLSNKILQVINPDGIQQSVLWELDKIYRQYHLCVESTPLEEIQKLNFYASVINDPNNKPRQVIWYRINDFDHWYLAEGRMALEQEKDVIEKARSMFDENLSPYKEFIENIRETRMEFNRDLPGINASTIGNKTIRVEIKVDDHCKIETESALIRQINPLLIRIVSNVTQTTI